MNSLRIFFILCLTCFVFMDVPVNSNQRELNINLNIVHMWADNFTSVLLGVSDIATGAGWYEDLHEQYKGTMIVNNKPIDKMLEEVRDKMEKMLRDKEIAIKDLMKAAEKANQQYGEYKTGEELDPEEMAYYNAKKLVSDDNMYQMDETAKANLKKTIHYLPLNESEELNYNRIDLNVSTIHVPTNIYDKSVKILNGVRWSENITEQFIENMEKDKGLTWQYFCSSDGFFRIYPGIIWPRDPDKVDMFDCRVRNWYIQAATTPKNIAILIDASGSMKGLRMEIARNTVDKILDTLSNDDYFNILQFSENVSYVDDCFNRTMMHASVHNRGRMQKMIKHVGTSKMANFTRALIEAFKLFETVEQDMQRILCNKAIMLVTDGAPENYEEIFAEYNWPNKTIRVFTYLIGKEVSDNRQVRWMACANKGDHKHISTRADVQENVQQYIKVLSRPMVQERYHNLIWTAAYLDYATEQTTMIDNPNNIFSLRNDLLGEKQETGFEGLITEDFNKGLGLMITAAMPVFDSRELTGNAENDSNHNLLGVVGTDVRTFELKKYISLHKLGVNGYAFAITNHGYIIFHPDFRPLFQKDNTSADLFPKPNYNSVDLTEVEFSDDPDKVKELRQGMLDHTYASMKMNVTVHLDKMRRYRKRTNWYYFKKVSNVFSLAFVVPDGYGKRQLRPQFHYKRSDAKYLDDKLLFTASWIFCLNKTSEQMVKLGKDDLKRFVRKELPELDCDNDLITLLMYDAKYTRNYTLQWSGSLNYWGRGKHGSESSVRREYAKCYHIKDNKTKTECHKEVHRKYGIEYIFIGTSSGVTRFMMVAWNESLLTDWDFAQSTRTVEEPYYKRAVDGWQDGYNYTFSLRQTSSGYGTSHDNATVVMSSPEILNRSRQKLEAVAAVTGLHMKYSAFQEIFVNITSECPPGYECDFTCNDTEYLNCYLLDHSGFVMISNNADGNDTGKFFGMVDPSLLQELVEKNIYNREMIIDYQGVCEIYASEVENSASVLLNPIQKLFSWTMWTLAELVIFHSNEHQMIRSPKWKIFQSQRFFSEFSFYSLVNTVSFIRGQDPETYEAKSGFAKDDVVDFYKNFLVFEGTREGIDIDSVVDFEACDKTVNLYSLNVSTLSATNRYGLTKSITGCEECNRFNQNGTYIVRWIRDTNLILVVAAANCSCGDGSEEMRSIEPQEVHYNETDKCKRVDKLRQPPRQMKCYDSTIEKGNICGAKSFRSSMLPLLLLVLKSLLS